MTGGRIIGWGSHLPDRVLTNADLEARLDTSDAWITERTGIKERRIGTSTAEMATAAGRAAIESAGIDPATIDLVVLCTSTSDRIIPAAASRVQHDLGLECGAFDLNAACAGFVYGLVVANGLCGVGARRVLLIGADQMSLITDPDDRGTVILFGDGAGAVVLDAVDDGEPQLLGWSTGSEGASEHILYAERGGFMQMQGREVFRQAVRVVVDSCQEAMAQAGVAAEDIALFVPHQANIRIVEAAASRLGIASDRWATVLHGTGNTSAGSIPLALVDAVEAGRVAPGDLVLTSGFGAGMSWASAVLRWDAPVASS